MRRTESWDRCARFHIDQKQVIPKFDDHAKCCVWVNSTQSRCRHLRSFSLFSYVCLSFKRKLNNVRNRYTNHSYDIDHTRPQPSWLQPEREKTAKCRQSKNENRHIYLFLFFFHFGDGKRITFRLLSKKSEHFQWNFRTGDQQCEEGDSRAVLTLGCERDSLRYFNAHVLSFSFDLMLNVYKNRSIRGTATRIAGLALYVLILCVTEKQQSKEVHVTRCVYFFVFDKTKTMNRFRCVWHRTRNGRIRI